jgi:hypothetical protein
MRGRKMITSICPICKNLRTSKLHTDDCSKKARLISIDRTKAPVQITPDFVEHRTPKRLKVYCS